MTVAAKHAGMLAAAGAYRKPPQVFILRFLPRNGGNRVAEPIDIKVLSTTAMKMVFEELAQRFERDTGNQRHHCGNAEHRYDTQS